MNNLEFFNDIVVLISFIVNLYFLLPLIYRIYNYFAKKRNILKILSYNNDPIQIYEPMRELKTVDEKDRYYISCDSLKSIHNLISIFSLVNKKFIFINQDDNARNEICIGSFLNNKRTNSYFFKYFHNFTYYVNIEYKEEYSKYPMNTTMIVYCKEKTGFRIGNGNFYETINGQIDFAFLIKLTPMDLNTNKVVHILFGEKANTTFKATEYLKTHHKEIYQKYKNNHYFFAVEINLIDNSFNLKKGIIDFTDEMFVK